MKNIAYIFLILILSATQFSCNHERKNNRGAAPKNQFETNYQKWMQNNISNYQFTLQRSCECMPDVTRPVTLRVVNNRIVSSKFANTDTNLSNDLQRNIYTIEGLFQLVRAAQKKGAHSIKVQYDSNYGYPTSIFIDHSAEIADDETILNVRHFQPS